MRQALLATFLSLFIAGQCVAGKVFLMTPADPAKTYPRALVRRFSWHAPSNITPWLFYVYGILD